MRKNVLKCTAGICCLTLQHIKSWGISTCILKEVTE